MEYKYILSAQRQALAARAGLGRKNPKVESAKGAEPLEGRRSPPLSATRGVGLRFGNIKVWVW
jgi:hypothetical protein